jgi:HAD superfamily hydrolase (TIGR01490 family)
MKLVLFDFDGTLTTKDSLNEFLKYAVGFPIYYLKLSIFSPIFVLYKLKLIKNDIAKQMLISLFFKGWSKSEFQEKAKQYSSTQIKKIVRKEIYDKFTQYIENGEKVIIVSASLECWLKPWCDLHDIDLLSTRLEFIDNKVTGKFATPNCHGKEKANRILKHLDVSKFDEIIAYGDSSGDIDMFEMSDYHHKVF